MEKTRNRRAWFKVSMGAVLNTLLSNEDRRRGAEAITSMSLGWAFKCFLSCSASVLGMVKPSIPEGTLLCLLELITASAVAHLIVWNLLQLLRKIGKATHNGGILMRDNSCVHYFFLDTRLNAMTGVRHPPSLVSEAFFTVPLNSKFRL